MLQITDGVCSVNHMYFEHLYMFCTENEVYSFYNVQTEAWEPIMNLTQHINMFIRTACIFAHLFIESSHFMHLSAFIYPKVNRFKDV